MRLLMTFLLAFGVVWVGGCARHAMTKLDGTSSVGPAQAAAPAASASVNP